MTTKTHPSTILAEVLLDRTDLPDDVTHTLRDDRQFALLATARMCLVWADDVTSDAGLAREYQLLACDVETAAIERMWDVLEAEGIDVEPGRHAPTDVAEVAP